MNMKEGRVISDKNVLLFIELFYINNKLDPNRHGRGEARVR